MQGFPQIRVGYGSECTRRPHRGQVDAHEPPSTTIPDFKEIHFADSGRIDLLHSEKLESPPASFMEHVSPLEDFHHWATINDVNAKALIRKS